MGNHTPAMQWDAALYQQKHHYVFEKGLDVLAFLNAQPQEKILDLGCGTGQLTHEIAKTGAYVLGLDSAAPMLEVAKSNYPELAFDCIDGAKLPFYQEFDAVFSNAALHWMQQDPQNVINSVFQALKPGGRFVFEMGAKGNVQQVIQGLTKGLIEIGQTPEEIQQKNPWYFPSLGEYAARLESMGFEIAYATTFDRPSPQENQEQGLRTWLLMFGKSFYSDLTESQLETALTTTEQALKPLLYKNDQWVADYRRLRMVALKPEVSEK